MSDVSFAFALPDPPRYRLPRVVSAAFAAVVAGAVFAVGLGVYAWADARAWSAAVIAAACLGAAMAVAAPLFALVEWTRAPRGGWPVAVAVPVRERAAVRAPLWIGAAAAVSTAAAWVFGAGEVLPLFTVLGVLVGAVPVACWHQLVAPHLASAAAVAAWYDRFRPRGLTEHDLLTPDQVATAAGHAVTDVVRLDLAHPKVPQTLPGIDDAIARYVLEDGSWMETRMVFATGPAEAHVPRTCARRVARSAVCDHRRFAPAAGGREAAFACVPRAGGPVTAWAAMVAVGVVELRASAGVDPAAPAVLAQAAADDFDPDWRAAT